MVEYRERCTCPCLDQQLAMRAHGGVNVYLYLLWTSALIRDRVHIYPRPISPRKRAVWYLLSNGWLGFRAGRDIEEQQNLFSLLEIESLLGRPTYNLVASLFIYVFIYIHLVHEISYMRPWDIELAEKYKYTNNCCNKNYKKNKMSDKKHNSKRRYVWYHYYQ